MSVSSRRCGCKDHDWNAEGVERNIRHTSAAVIADPDAAPELRPRDVGFYHQPSTWPGAKPPHAWLVDERGRRLSTLDVVGHGRMTVMTGLAGQAWADAVNEQKLDWLTAAVIGQAGLRDPYLLRMATAA